MVRASITSIAVAAVLFSSGVYAQDSAKAAPKAPMATPELVAQKAVDNEAQAAPSTDEQLMKLQGKLDGLDEPLATMQSTVNALSKIKISGYAYGQFRYTPNYKSATDSTKTGQKAANEHTYGYAIGDYAGGAFGTRMSSQFQLREARLKAAYEADLTTVVFQIDMAPFTNTNEINSLTTTVDTVKDSAGVKHAVLKSVSSANVAAFNGGGVSLKDAYVRFTEPWLRSFALKTGIFDRPFGFEIAYSSSLRESPERSRAEQTLFPNERDLGVSLEFMPSDNMPQWAKYINFKGGLFTGDGINLEVDDNRDFIGRLGTSIPLSDLNLSIDAGVSGYFGKITDLSDSVYTVTNGTWGGTKGHSRENINRQYIGGDAEINFGNVPVLGGTALRGELYTGKQPVFGNSNTKSFASNLTSTSAVYVRNFTGYYAMLVQNVDPINSQIVLKYDSYDPNTDLSSDQIKSLADVAFNTIGLGLIYHWDSNVKFMLYYDMPMNEKCKNVTTTGYSFGDVLPANVLTARIQGAF